MTSTISKPVPQRKSTPEEKAAAFKKAITVLKNSGAAIKKPTVAHRAAIYLPESAAQLLNSLKKMTPDELSAIGFVTEEEMKPIGLKTRPIRVGDWNIRLRTPKRHIP